MQAIGGYLELELPKGNEYFQNAIRLNTGRNALEYILRAKKYKKVFLPHYTCDAMLEPLNKLVLEFEYYHIDKTFRPIFNFSQTKEEDVFIYTNYFGICDKQCTEIADKCKNLIIDNSQAFFSKPLPDVDTFYSPRKFFGVPDGAYLFTERRLEAQIEQDSSYQRCEHLVGRIDIGPERFYETFISNNSSLTCQSIKTMSNLTRRILESIDYVDMARKRVSNFNILHGYLRDLNPIEFNLTPNSVPMVYPYLSKNGFELKNKLIANKIYIATYWPNVFKTASRNSFEHFLVENLLCLPIDQRYDSDEMYNILKLLNELDE